jgi:hypothetical protein
MMRTVRNNGTDRGAADVPGAALSADCSAGSASADLALAAAGTNVAAAVDQHVLESGRSS